MTSVLSVFDTYTAHQRPMVGDTKTSAVNVDHVGWLKCDGRVLNVNDYYFLWEVIGYSFGGSGSQFLLPDPSGRVAGFIGTSVGNSWNMGDLSGEETHTLTIPEMPIHDHSGNTDLSGVHSHTTNATGGQGDSHYGTGLAFADGTNTRITTDSSPDTGELNLAGPPRALVINNDGLHKHHFITEVRGGSLPHNNIQPTIFMGNMFIYSGKPNQGNYPYFVGGLL